MLPEGCASERLVTPAIPDVNEEDLNELFMLSGSSVELSVPEGVEEEDEEELALLLRMVVSMVEMREGVGAAGRSLDSRRPFSKRKTVR